jgi:hypothetical protein
MGFIASNGEHDTDHLIWKDMEESSYGATYNRRKIQCKRTQQEDSREAEEFPWYEVL